jgi:hypothetical protein
MRRKDGKKKGGDTLKRIFKQNVKEKYFGKAKSG